MANYYRIAHITLRLEEPHFSFSGLVPFLTEPIEQPDIEVVSAHDLATDTTAMVLIDRFDFRDANAVCELYQKGEGHHFQMVTECGECVVFDIPAEGIVRTNFQPDQQQALFRFGLWMTFNIRAARRSTLAIHSSVLVHNSGAVLCLGESGTGKSTHTRLWREHIPATELLNDDSPIIRIDEGVAYVYGSPWSGKTPCYRNEHYPIRAILRLSQGPSNKIRPLSILQSYGALQPSFPPSFAHDKVLFGHTNRLLSELLKRVKVYHLSCLPNGEAAELARTTIYE